MAKKRYREGSVIEIKINGVPIKTKIINGVQRLPDNKFLSALMDKGHSFGMGYNELAIMSQETRSSGVTREHRRQIYQNVGYSVCGYSDVFPEDKIENPLWD